MKVHRHTVVTLLLAIAALAAVDAFPSCGSKTLFTASPVDLKCPTKAGGPVTLVVGARANSQRPDLPDLITGLIKEASKKSQKIQMIRIDGAPTVAMKAVFHTDGQNQQIRDTDLQTFMDQITQIETGVRPKVAQADVLGALSQAGQITPAGGTIVLIDSGIPTMGPISFTNPEMFGADPAEVVKFLDQQNLMPDLTGLSVDLVGIGDVAGQQQSQAPVSTADAANIDALWKAIAHAAGASCVDNVATEVTHAAVATSVPVDVVKPPAPPVFKNCGTTILSDAGSVGFKVGTAAFRHPTAAMATLRQLANLLRGHDQLVELDGTTSSEGSDASNKALSERRAAAVKAILVSLGIDTGRITTKGYGEHWPNRVVDMKNGVLIPWAAEQNRSVVVKLTCPSH